MQIPDIQHAEFRHLSESFLTYLEEMSYKPSTLTLYRQVLQRIDFYMSECKIPDYSPYIGQAFLDKYMSLHANDKSKGKMPRTIVARLNDYFCHKPFVLQHTVGSTYDIAEDGLEATSSFLAMCMSSGNKAATIRKKRAAVMIFLQICHSMGCENLKLLTPSIVVGACMHIDNKDSLPIIQAFLRFLCSENIIAQDFSTLIPHGHRPFKIPSTYTQEEISLLEQAINHTSPKGIRDYAMILLASRLGMRSGDIANLELGDIDFNLDRIHFIQQKTGTEISLPLLDEIRQALQRYINCVRPEISDSKLFLRINAPYEPVTTSTIRFAVSQYFTQAGIDTAEKHHGPHTLRASLATSMVNQNIPYEVIRTILGHRDPNAVKHYAKLDIEQLRKCAIPVPPPTGQFKAFLEGGAEE